MGLVNTAKHVKDDKRLLAKSLHVIHDSLFRHIGVQA